MKIATSHVPACLGTSTAGSEAAPSPGSPIASLPAQPPDRSRGRTGVAVERDGDAGDRTTRRRIRTLNHGAFVIGRSV